MRDEDIQEVWSMLDRPHLCALAQRGPEVSFATISGAHLYGFASPDSDVDVRGAVLFPLERILGLEPPDETISIAEKQPIDVDFVAHDLRKFIRLLVTHNGYVLEQLFSPLVLIAGPELPELRELGRGCITRPLVRHYSGFAKGRRARLREPAPTVKHLLYAYRVLLAGIHVMRAGEIESNLVVLESLSPSAHVRSLISRKREGSEGMALEPREVIEEERRLDQLEAELRDAHEKSRLPEQPTTRDALEALVVRARLKPARVTGSRPHHGVPSVDLDRDTIFLTLAGSHAHGTARAESDLDVRGVCIAPSAIRISPFQHFEQIEASLEGGLARELHALLPTHPSASTSSTERIESVVYDLSKFVVMLSAQNPSALEILFSDERDWVRVRPTWTRLYEQRSRFLSRRLRHTYAGYAKAQLRKISTHRSWLLSPPAAPPVRSAFGLPYRSTLSADVINRIESSIEDRLASYRFDDLEMPKATRVALRERTATLLREVLQGEADDVAGELERVATHALGISGEVTRTLEAERRYRRALREWHAYEAHRTRRNVDRAALEAKYGYDTKHAMHLVRLYRSGLELLETGELRVRRADADELVAIRRGAFTYEQLLASVEGLEERLSAAAAASPLPEDVELGAIEALLVELLS